MLQKLDSPDTVLALEAVGTLGQEDYETVLVPGITQQIERFGEIRVVFVFADAFEGLTLGATAVRRQALRR